jgi:adenylate cyclase
MVPARASTPLLIVFMDLTRFNAQGLKTADDVVADTIDRYYEMTGQAVRQAGGTVVKFIGDAVLAVFPEDGVDWAAAMLLDLKDAVDQMMTQQGWECRLNAKAHFGPVMAGSFGERGAKRYDVIGANVNITARLESHGITLSAEAFRKLGPDMRTRFRKHTPPISYIRAEDPRPRAPRG